jgi:uncharacterized protein (TIGR02722 family)
MKKLIMLNVLALAALLLLAGCAPQGKVVTRTDPNEQFDLSGDWNDVDSKQVAYALYNQITGSAWVEDFRGERGKKPVLIFGQVRNKTTEHIDTGVFHKDFENSFINSGRVTVVTSADERQQIRAERADQQEFSSPETMKQWGREKGADFMFIGEITSILDREGGATVKYYRVDCYLVDLEDNTKVWAGSEEIKKLVEQ